MPKVFLTISSIVSMNDDILSHQAHPFSIFNYSGMTVAHFCHRVNFPDQKYYVYENCSSDLERKWFSDHFLRSLRSYELGRVVLVNHIAQKIITCSPAFVQAFRKEYPKWTYHLVKQNEFILKAWEELIEYCKIL